MGKKESPEADDTELTHKVYAKKAGDKAGKELESKVLQRVKELCAERLALYPTTLAEDNALLGKHDEAVARGATAEDSEDVLPLRRLWAITFRCEEKLVLQETIDKHTEVAKPKKRRRKGGST